MADDPAENVRLDKWLWAARFYKTRSLAAEAVSGGKVHLNGARVKPARAVSAGDELRIRRGPDECVVVVRGVSARRGPAKVAATLYEEDPASLERRKRERELRRLNAQASPVSVGRPDKKTRREIRRLSGKD